MARINYSGIVDSITGKINGSVFQRNKSGFIMRSVGAVKRSSTALQTQQQNVIMALVREYNLLSVSEKSLWNDFAALHPRTNDYGRSLLLTGCNYYTHINYNLDLVGSAHISEPPVYELPPVVTAKYITPETYNFYLCNSESTGPATTRTIIYCTPITLGLNAVPNQLLKFVDVVEFNAIECLQFRDLYNAVHFPQYSQDLFTNGAAIGFKFVNVDTVTGLSSVALKQILV